MLGRLKTMAGSFAVAFAFGVLLVAQTAGGADDQSESIEVLYFAAEDAFNEGDFKTAVQKFEAADRAMEGGLQGKTSLYYYATSLYRLKRYDDALEMFDERVLNTPMQGDGVIWMRPLPSSTRFSSLGMRVSCLLELGKNQEAEQAMVELRRGYDQERKSIAAVAPWFDRLENQVFKKEPESFHHPFTNPIDDPALPRVLIIGDSISIAYTTTVRRELAGKANVHRIPGNAAYSANGLAKIEEWLGEGDWDVIHFNFGLWDWYGWKQEERVTVAFYLANLEGILEALAQTDATLIFATTTPPCREPEHKIKVQVSDDEAKRFNAAASELMQSKGVVVNDLYNDLLPHRDEYAKGPADVHFAPEGNIFLGKRVAAVIAKVLEERE